jgi:hypothetical protein
MKKGGEEGRLGAGVEKMTGSRIIVVEGLYVHLSCTISDYKTVADNN